MSIVQIAQQADFFNVTIDGISFTADKCDREWVVGYGEKNALEVEQLANSAGLTVDEFWAHYQALLNDAVGW